MHRCLKYKRNIFKDKSSTILEEKHFWAQLVNNCNHGDTIVIKIKQMTEHSEQIVGLATNKKKLHLRSIKHTLFLVAGRVVYLHLHFIQLMEIRKYSCSKCPEI